MAHAGAEFHGSDRVRLETVDAIVASGLIVVVVAPTVGPVVAELENRGIEVLVQSSRTAKKRAPSRWVHTDACGRD